jgi:protoporphyrin/coproporphyrin ferrochelatase
MATIDVALLAFGGPESTAKVPDFLARMTGRPADPQMVAVVEQRYLQIGGGSPLPEITRRQAVALQANMLAQLGVGVRVRPGLLYSEPTVADSLKGLDLQSAVALPMSPYSSRLTTDAYRKALDAAGGVEVPLVDGWFADRRFVAAVSARIAEALDCADINEYALVFTAHSVPMDIVMEGDPYADQIQQTVAQLVAVTAPGDWRLGFQSKGRRGGDWLGPEVDDVVRELAEAGWKKLLVVPVGFVSDHVETLYDLDIVLRAVVEGLGLRYQRTQALNDSPRFIEAMADIVIAYLAGRPILHPVELDPQGSHQHGRGGAPEA